MSILKYRYCPSCGEKTYHRYKNILRNRFVTSSCWECVACQKALSRRKRRSEQDTAINPA